MKKHKISITLVLLCTLGYGAKAQFLDSIRAALNRKASFSFSFNSRNSFITTEKAHIWGFMVGVCFDRKIAMGGGINTLNSSIQRMQTIEGQNVQTSLNLFYISYYVEYLCRLTKHWALDIPVSVGIGNSSFSYTLANSKQIVDQRGVIPFEPDVEVDYDFNKYFGLYVEAGYRLMLINNKEINEDFNSLTYSYGLLIYPLEIYAALFPHTGLAHTINNN